MRGAVAESEGAHDLFRRRGAKAGRAAVVVCARTLRDARAPLLGGAGWRARPSWFEVAQQSPVPAAFSRKFPWLVKILLDSDFAQ